MHRNPPVAGICRGDAQNPAFNGTCDITVHLISLAYRFGF
jgi:hypothetical protein